jgi:8-oxo-dGTP pyrophosphatase MutT (NUDIX family)
VPDPGAIQVRAAGGIVTRAGTDGAEVLVVHRPAYDDWSLPKGKLEPGEDDETAARREVLEETGVDAVVVGRAGSVRYTDRRGRSKHVEYFTMAAHTSSARVPDDEVDVVAWWPVATAATELTYPHDRELVAEHAP